MKLVVEGLTDRQVVQQLGLAEQTVANNLFRIYEKLGISSRVELVLYARTPTKLSHSIYLACGRPLGSITPESTGSVVLLQGNFVAIRHHLPNHLSFPAEPFTLGRMDSLHS